MNLDNLISIVDAMAQYGRSRGYLEARIADGTLSRADIPGDKRVYLLRSELAAFFTPRITKQPREDKANDANVQS